MIILDTNVISEIFRPHPDERVIGWLRSLTGDVAITTVTLAELLAGVGRPPDARRKQELATRIETAIEPHREGRSILPFDDAAAEPYADVLAAREAVGQPISTADAQIAAICRAHGAVYATRNGKDFAATGLRVVDPWA